MRRQAEIAISTADVIVMVTDIKVGMTAADNEVATMFAVGSILQMHTGAVLVAVDNLATGEAIDFETEYDKLIADAIELGTKALAKLIQK